MDEPAIIISGKMLSAGQAMTLRVALESFAMTVSAEGLGDDEHGKKMAAAYLARVDEIRAFMYAPRRGGGE